MYDKDNIFAKIIDGRIPAEKLYEDDKLIAIRDINPVAPIHILVIPKQGYLDYEDFITHARPDDIAHYYQAIAKIAGAQGAGDYRLVTNKGAKAGQSIFHFHTHIIGGKSIGELLDKGL